MKKGQQKKDLFLVSMVSVVIIIGIFAMILNTYNSATLIPDIVAKDVTYDMAFAKNVTRVNATVDRDESCSDTDGFDIGTKGVVTYNKEDSLLTREYTDFCTDNGDNTFYLTEYWCNSDSLEYTEYNIYPDTGYTCMKGARLEIYCSDSDSGNNPEEKGTLNMRTVSAEKTYTDSCTWDDFSRYGYLREHWCDGDDSDAANLACDSDQACYDGACRTIDSCSDSDGDDGYEYGTVTMSYTTDGVSNSVEYSDTCSGSDYVTEYLCDNIYLESDLVKCDLGYDCVDGACVEETCTSDSDCSDFGYHCGDESVCVKYPDFAISDVEVYAYEAIATNKVRLFLSVKNNGGESAKVNKISYLFAYYYDSGVGTDFGTFYNTQPIAAGDTLVIEKGWDYNDMISALADGETVRLSYTIQVDYDDDTGEVYESNNKATGTLISGQKGFTFVPDK
ncbi:hypothetical protein COV16_04185 [Candidatus Woesearchaeota archaeon CG10_big_fil_rev_8_21_14_0_10_34_8]|nr:MAG: hypothetical protein COV16_04185 [Candidatus Woesearchaeota archaeon CG10_big_fil_rev_8_21_14_0_10_34_8]